MSALFAGGGVQGGQIFGSSDRLAAFPQDHPVSPCDIAHTVYSAMGIDNLTATDHGGRTFQLLQGSRPIHQLF